MQRERERVTQPCCISVTSVWCSHFAAGNPLGASMVRAEMNQTKRNHMGEGPCDFEHVLPAKVCGCMKVAVKLTLCS